MLVLKKILDIFHSTVHVTSQLNHSKFMVLKSKTQEPKRTTNQVLYSSVSLQAIQAQQQLTTSTHIGYNGSVGNPNGSPQNFLGGTNPTGFLFDETAADFSIEGTQIAEIAISRLIDGSFSGTWYNPVDYKGACQL